MHVMMVNIPCLRHGEEKYVEAKTRELSDLPHFIVYEIVDIPNNAKKIGTEWVLEEKDDSLGTKAWLCSLG